jgi:ribosomal RNA-processing protein 7
MAALPPSIAGFTVLPVTYASSSTHIIYARPHKGSKKPRGDSFPDGRTLFLVNVPPDATERELFLLFKHCGTVERVAFDSDASLQPDSDEDDLDEGGGEGDDMEVEDDESGDEGHPRKKRKIVKEDKRKPPKVTPLPQTSLRTLRRTGRTAHIVFLDSSSMEKAISSQKPRPWPSSEEPSGLSHYIALYDSLRPPLDIVREHADTSMELYEYELAKTKQKSKYRKGEAIVDEDGFTLVTRGGAYGQTLGGGVGVASKKFQETGQTRNRNKKKKNLKEKVEFYAFQKAEKQRKGAFYTLLCCGQY